MYTNSEPRNCWIRVGSMLSHKLKYSVKLLIVASGNLSKYSTNCKGQVKQNVTEGCDLNVYSLSSLVYCSNSRSFTVVDVDSTLTVVMFNTLVHLNLIDTQI